MTIGIIGQAELTNLSTPTLVATMPDPLGDTVSIDISNNTASPILATVWLVPAGTSTPANMHKVRSVYVAGNAYMTKTPNALGNGDQVFVLPSAVGLSCTVMGCKN